MDQLSVWNVEKQAFVPFDSQCNTVLAKPEIILPRPLDEWDDMEAADIWIGPLDEDSSWLDTILQI